MLELFFIVGILWFYIDQSFYRCVWLTRFENDRTIIVRPSRWSFLSDDLQTYTQVCPLCIATRNHLVTYQIASPGTHLALVHDPSSFWFVLHVKHLIFISP
jgi:hypothetical protein